MIKTLTIDNFGGRMTQYVDGDINSGLANITETFGSDPFSKPGNLTWGETATQIDSSYAVLTDMIMAGKERVESGILYVYCVGHTGRVYKIQVNNPATYNPDYDNPVLLTTITSGTPTFTRGGFIDFFGSTERIYIGHDKGVTRIDFNGANETAISGTWTQTVPRPLKQLLGKLYVGNGSNIAEIDSSATVTTSTKLTPGFPTNSQVRDIDTTTDGNYLQIVVSNLALSDLTATTQDTSQTANSSSYVFKWNGTDTGYTAFDTFPSFSLTANTTFGPYQYTFGYDLIGTAVYNPINKIITSPLEQAPLPNAVSSNGNFVGWFDTLYYNGFSEVLQSLYGSLDREVGTGYWCQFSAGATGTETDVLRVPMALLISNLGIGASSNGYPGNVFGTGKLYFSTLETSASPTTKYKLYKWFPVATGAGTAIEGVYQTQTQLFSKKVKVKEVRIYGEPWVANNSFTIDLIGSAGTPMTNGSKTFTAGTDLTIGDDFAWYTPDNAPSYAVGVRITNVGTVNHTINKIEFDFDEIAGK